MIVVPLEFAWAAKEVPRATRVAVDASHGFTELQRTRIPGCAPGKGSSTYTPGVAFSSA